MLLKVMLGVVSLGVLLEAIFSGVTGCVTRLSLQRDA